LRAVEAYHWPGNVRELRNVLERALLLSDAPVLRREDLHFDVPEAAPAQAPGAAPGITLRDAERGHIARVLDAHGWKVDLAAQALGISRSTLYEKIRAYRLQRS
jgi:two-component system NtrC family response regulator